MNNIAHEAVVIGGGPAGSAAAIRLAEAGNQICLLERKRGAHNKVCGEFISWEAAHYLEELGLDLPALGAQAIHAVRLYDGEATIETALPFPAWSLSRRRLDAVLLEQAEQAGVMVQRGVAVRDLIRTNHGWTLNTTQQTGLRANAVFLASGKHDLRHWRRKQGHQHQDLLGLKMHLQLDEPQQERLQGNVEIHLFDGGYAGLEPVENGAANLCFLVSKDIYNACGKSWPALLSWLSNTSSHMKERLAGSKSLWSRPLAVYGIPYGYLHHPASAVPGLFRLGDQIAVIPSFAGDGIAIALHTAFLAARTHAAGADSTPYHQQASKELHRPMRDARILARLLSHTQGRRAAFLLSRLWPGAMANVICRIRLERV